MNLLVNSWYTCSAELSRLCAVAQGILSNTSKTDHSHIIFHKIVSNSFWDICSTLMLSKSYHWPKIATRSLPLKKTPHFPTYPRKLCSLSYHPLLCWPKWRRIFHRDRGPWAAKVTFQEPHGWPTSRVHGPPWNKRLYDHGLWKPCGFP